MSKILKLVLPEEVEKRHLRYFEENIKPKFLDKNLLWDEGIYQSYHEVFLNYCYEELETIAIGKPEKLKSFYYNLPSPAKKILDTNPVISEGFAYRDFISTLFGYDDFSSLNKYVSEELLKDFNNFEANYIKEKWTPYTLLFLSGIRVCPYCNRQYITPLYQHSNKKGKKVKLRADLDHFYPKFKYPYFSMSLYNLVPCCKFCNTSLKGTKEFTFDDLNPYEKNFNDYFKFKIDVFNKDKVLLYKKDKCVENYLDIFQIENLYHYHKNQAIELIQKKYMYPDTYINELFGEYVEYFNSREELKGLLIGHVTKKEDINNEVLSKFRRDISMQLGFIKDEVSSKLIVELEKLIEDKKFNL